jgi:hypothetical protein
MRKKECMEDFGEEARRKVHTRKTKYTRCRILKWILHKNMIEWYGLDWLRTSARILRAL